MGCSRFSQTKQRHWQISRKKLQKNRLKPASRSNRLSDDQAESILRKARDKYIQLYGPDSHEIKAVSASLANLQLRKGNYGEADKLLRHNIDIERAEANRGNLNATALSTALGAYGAMLDGIGLPMFGSGLTCSLWAREH